MQKFDNIKEVNSWLKSQPDSVASVFSARAALRCLPLISRINNDDVSKSSLGEATLSAFCAISVALNQLDFQAYKHVSKFSNRHNFRDQVVKDVLQAAHNSSQGGAVRSISKSISLSAELSAEVYVANTVQNSSVFDSSYTATIVRSIILKEYSFDRDYISEGKNADGLAGRKLWQASVRSEDDDFAIKFLNRWTSLKDTLLSFTNHDWIVWTDWYEDRLKGVPLVKEIEIGDPKNGKFGRVTFPSEDYKNPSILNPKIKALVDEYATRMDISEQDNTVETFGLNENGYVDYTTGSTSEGLTETPQQHDWYNSLRQAALGLKDIGENALGRAARPIDNLLEALPNEFTDAKVALLWPAANRVRRLKSAHDKAVDIGDDYHPNRLSPEVVDDIDQFVGVYNNLVLGDENLTEADRRALGPQEIETVLEANELATDVLETAAENNMLTEEAAEVILEVIAEDKQIAASTDLSVLERLALDNNARVKNNALRAIVTQIRDSDQYKSFQGGFYKSLGSTWAKALIAAVAMINPSLRALVISILGKVM